MIFECAATIGLLAKDLGNEFYATIASAVAGVAKTRGFQLITTHSGENPEDEMAAVKDLCRRRIDGLLIVPTGGDHAALKKKIELGIPMDFLDRAPTIWKRIVSFSTTSLEPTLERANC